jgi:hypothetical protein
MKTPSHKAADPTSKESMLRLILRAAKKAGVKMAIGGGLAANAHGFRRETDDVDAFFHYDDQRKVLRALSKLAPGFVIEQIDPSQWIAVPPGAEANQRIDLLFASGDPEESAIEMSEPGRYHGIEAPMFAADWLVVSKYLAEREEAKDILDIYTLHKRGAFEINEIVGRLRQMGMDEDAERFPRFMSSLGELVARKGG